MSINISCAKKIYHFLELPADKFCEIDSPLLTFMDPTYQSGDDLVITEAGSRKQITVGITKVLKEKVNGKWCYLVLNGLDDITLSGVLNRNLSQRGAEG